MKKPLLLLAAMLLSFISSLQGYAANRIDYTAKFDLPEELTKSNQKPGRQSAFSTLTLKDGGQYGEVGAPALPMKTFQFLVPVYTGKFTVTAKWPEKPAFSAKLTERLKPVQKPFTTSEKFVETLPDEKAYSRIYEANAHVVNDYFIDGSNHIVTVEVSPVTYDPVAGTLAIYDNVDLSLSYSEVSEADMPMKPIFTEKPDKNLDLSEIVVNFSSTKPMYTIAENDSYAGNYIIVSTNELLPSFNTLANWKRQLGFNVIIRSIDSIVEDSNYDNGDIVSGMNDKAGKLRAFLKDCYRQLGRSYVLLGGDYNVDFPYRLGVGWNDFTKISTDVYFSDMTGQWDSSDCFYLNFGKKINYYPDMIVGRLLCKTPEEVNNYTEKLLNYEINPGLGNSSYLTNAIFVENNDFDGTYTEILPYVEQGFDNVTTMISKDQEQIFYKGSELISEMNKKRGFTYVGGHGQPTKITISQGNNSSGNWGYSINAQESYLTNKTWDPIRSFDNLTNYSFPGVFYAAACTTMPFNQTTDSKEYNMGSAYTVAGTYGGVAYIGRTSEGNISLEPSMAKLFLNESFYNEPLGKAVGNARYKFLNNNEIKPGTNQVLLSLNYLGDPALRMWNKAPQKMNLSLSSNTSGESIIINPALSGKALVSVYDGNYITSCKIFPMNSSSCVLPNYTNKALTISMPGYLPTIWLNLTSPENVISQTKTFIANDVNIGTQSSIGHSGTQYSLNLGSKVYIYASGNVTINCGLYLENSSYMEIHCDGDVTVKGATIDTGSRLVIKLRGNYIKQKAFKTQSGGMVTVEKL